MTDEWLAGFFDGEGCISGQSCFIATKYIKHPRVNIQVSISQKDRTVLEEIQKNYGGTICRKGNGCHAIRWTGKNNMKYILTILAAHCICKREQALLGLKFVDTLREESSGCEPLPKHIHAERKEVSDKLRTLKVVNGHNVS